MLRTRPASRQCSSSIFKHALPPRHTGKALEPRGAVTLHSQNPLHASPWARGSEFG